MWNRSYYESTGKQEIETRVNYYLDEECSEYKKKEVIGFIRSHQYIEREKLNSPPDYLINLKNGIYNRKTKKLMPHTADIYFLYEIPWDYDPDAECPKILEFFESTVSLNDIPILQELLGDCLQPTYKYKKALICVGPTDTSKSQLLSLFGEFLGKKNTSHAALYDLCHDRFSAIDLYGKLANICADIDATGIRATKVFLMLTGGDILRGQKKHKDAFNFRNYAILIYSCNEIPETKNKNPAYFNRWLVLEFDNIIPKEEQIPFFYETLTTPEEMSGLLNYALEGLENLEKNGGYSEHRSIEEIQEFMETHKKPIPEFARDHIQPDEQHREITKEHLYKNYVEFCRLFNYPIKANNVFSRDVKRYLPSSYDEGQSRKTEYLEKADFPVLGICAGHQFMARYFGGEVKPAETPEFVKIELMLLKEGDLLFKGVPQKSIVWESHNDEIALLPDDFELLAESESCKIQAMRHKKKPFYGLQLHPEVEHTEYGKTIFKNFVKLCES